MRRCGRWRPKQIWRKPCVPCRPCPLRRFSKSKSVSGRAKTSGARRRPRKRTKKGLWITSMTQTEYIGEGAIQKLGDTVSSFAPKKVFLVTGKASYAASGAAAAVEKALRDCEVLHYTDFGALPLQEDIDKGITAYKAFGPGLVIAVGGGHVMDIAKAINFYAGKKPLIAIPTTAGSGSEATRFAVVYKDGRKTSLESPEILPAVAIVDPALAQSVPKKVALASGLDALAQSIESLWSLQASEESKGYAKAALELVWNNIIPAIEERDKE